MKWFYFVGLLLLVIVSVQAEEESKRLQDITTDDNLDNIDIKAAVKELLEKKCEQAGGKALVEKFTEAIDTAKVCFEEHLPKHTDKFKELKDSSSSEELCSDKRFKLRKCFADLIEVLKECSDPEEKYLPQFVFDGLDALLDYICADNGVIVLKIFDDKTLECVFSLAENDNITDAWEDKFKFLKDDVPEDIIITKAELCEDLTTAKNYFADYIKKQCPDDTNLRDIVIGIYNAVSSPCTKDETNPLNLKLPGSK